MDQYINTSNLNIGLVVFKECPPGFLVVRALDGCVAWLQRCANNFGRDWRRTRHVHILGWARRLCGGLADITVHSGLEGCARRVLHRYQLQASLSRGWRTALDCDTARFDAAAWRRHLCGLHGWGLAFRSGGLGGWKLSLRRHQRSTFGVLGLRFIGIREAFRVQGFGVYILALFRVYRD